MSAPQNPLTPDPSRHTPTSRNLDVPDRALVIGAHPDDADFLAGGTLAKWAGSGCEVSVLVCTDGSKGTWDSSADTADLVATRVAEQQASAQVLGATGEVGFLGRVDGELDSSLETRAEVVQWIRRVRPDVVIGHDPWKRYRIHPDHRHAGWLCTDGVVAARDPKFFPDQGLEPHRPACILLGEADEPDHAEDVTGFDGTKLEALAAHRSQYESTMFGDDFRSALRRKLSDAGDAAGFVHAELFTLIDDL